MTRDELKIRTQQIVGAIPVLRKMKYGWAEIEKMLNEILIELGDSPWHTDTPTEKGAYLVTDGLSDYAICYFDGERFGTAYYDAHGDGKVVKWQKIEPDKEDKD